MSICKRNGANFNKVIKMTAIFATVGMLAACGDSSSSDANDDGYDEAVQTLTDIRDNQVYRTVKIGSQTWMAENLNYETEDSYCYNDSASYCAKYGRLYTWAAAINACPNGWHLPDTTEWKTLFTTVGRPTADKLKSTSGWIDSEGKDDNGTDDFGFSAFPAGAVYYNENTSILNISPFVGEGMYTGFWSSTSYIYLMGLISEGKNAFIDDIGTESSAYSVRCIKD